MYSILAVLTTVLAASASACPQYNYTQMGRNWARQCDEWFLCGNGTQQSPINLPANSFASTHEPILRFPGGTSLRGELRSNGFAPQWTPNAGVQVPSVEFDRQTWNLLQWHTHTPTSEHAVGGVKSRAEIHFVFGAGTTAHAVLGFRMDMGYGSSFWNTIFSNLNRQHRQLPDPETNRPVNVTVDFSSLLNQNFFAANNYWTYQGSLTTPDCAQGVRWYVSAHTDGLSAAQLGRLEAASEDSVRALQPLREQTVNQ